jgi:hypothetical protein
LKRLGVRTFFVILSEAKNLWFSVAHLKQLARDV